MISRPPEHLFGGCVTVGAILVHDDDVLLAITTATAYPQGFEFTLHVRNRWRPERGTIPAQDLFHGPNSLILEIVCGDRRLARADALRPPELLAGDDAAFFPLGGAGSSTRMDMRYWVAPLPLPTEQVVINAAWPAREIEPVSITLPAGGLAAAGRSAITLWSPQDGATRS